MTPQERYHEATIGSYQRARAIAPATITRDSQTNFIDLAELSDFLQKSCGTCTSRTNCSDFAMMQNNERVCKLDLGRCKYSFPSRSINRAESVECKNYKAAN